MADKRHVSDMFRGKVWRMVEAVFRAISEGKLTQEQFLALLRNAREGMVLLPEPARQYDSRLSTLEDQRNRLLHLGEGRMPAQWLDDLIRLELPDHTQSLRNCAVLYRTGATLAETIAIWQLLLAHTVVESRGVTYLRHRLRDDEPWASDDAAGQETGSWKIVYLDLLAGWKSYQDLAIDEVDNEEGAGRQAGPEVLAALALNPGIIAVMDGGRRLPQMFMPGIRLPGHPSRSAAVVRRDSHSDYREVLDIDEISTRKRFRGTSAPRVLRSEWVAAA